RLEIRSKACRCRKSSESSWLKPPIEEGIVDRLPIRKQHHPEVPTFHFGDPCPASDASVCLDMLLHRSDYGPFNPLVEDQRPIRSGTNRSEVSGGLQSSCS